MATEHELPPAIAAIVAEHEHRMRSRAPYMILLLAGMGLLTPLMMLRRPGADSLEMALMCLVFPGLPCFVLAFVLARRMVASAAEIRAALVAKQVFVITIVQRSVNGIPAAKVIELGRGSNLDPLLLSVAPENVVRAAATLQSWVRDPS